MITTKRQVAIDQNKMLDSLLMFPAELDDYSIKKNAILRFIFKDVSPSSYLDLDIMKEYTNQKMAHQHLISCTKEGVFPFSYTSFKYVIKDIGDGKFIPSETGLLVFQNNLVTPKSHLFEGSLDQLKPFCLEFAIEKEDRLLRKVPIHPYYRGHNMSPPNAPCYTHRYDEEVVAPQQGIRNFREKHLKQIITDGYKLAIARFVINEEGRNECMFLGDNDKLLIDVCLTEFPEKPGEKLLNWLETISKT